jgi:hypothetical protein
MNIWQNELLVDCHRQDVVQDMQQIHLENYALKSRVYHPGVFERTMFRFANWMISAGKRLRARYEVPTFDGGNSPAAVHTN